jgi:hypothetical protein
MKYLPPAVALPLAVAALLGAGYLYYIASQRRGKKRALPLAFAIVLTVVAALQPVLAFDSVRGRLSRGVKRLRQGPLAKSSGNNGLTVPGATLFS